MLTTPNGTATYPPTAHPTVAAHLRSIVRWPFTNRLASPIWLAVRLYLAYTWFTMGLDKFSSGFLTGDPIGQMLGMAGNGALPVPLEAYRPVARWLVDLGLTPLLSHSMPFLELAVALSFISGILLVPAALGAVFLNANFLLSGVGIAQLDGLCIVLQLLLLLAFRVAGYIGVQRITMRVISSTLYIFVGLVCVVLERMRLF
jgi:uncharacterized membrane protein YphA (DoxX/SURF4 family)